MNPYDRVVMTASPQKHQSLAGRVHYKLIRLFLFVSLGVFLQSCVEIRQKDKTSKAAYEPEIPRKSDFAGSRNSLRVLMVGDSLTVGGFGEAMQAYLLRRFGSNNVAVFASCGSSP